MKIIRVYIYYTRPIPLNNYLRTSTKFSQFYSWILELAPIALLLVSILQQLMSYIHLNIHKRHLTHHKISGPTITPVSRETQHLQHLTFLSEFQAYFTNQGRCMHAKMTGILFNSCYARYTTREYTWPSDNWLHTYVAIDSDFNTICTDYVIMRHWSTLNLNYFAYKLECIILTIREGASYMFHSVMTVLLEYFKFVGYYRTNYIVIQPMPKFYQ